MSLREEYVKLAADLDKVDAEIQERYMRIDDIRKMRSSMLMDILKEEDILNEGPWDVRVSSENNKISLYGGYHDDRENWVNGHDNGIYRPKLFDLFCDNSWGDMHFSVDEYGVRIDGYDGEVYIQFDNNDCVAPFLRQFRLTLNFSQLEQRAKELEAIITIHEFFKEEFNNL